MSFALVITEKPSVAKDIAQVVGATGMEKGYFTGNNYFVTWALGHLLRLPEPHEIDPKWKFWRKSDLPILPRDWNLQIIERSESQLRVIESLIKKSQELICATDAGREGELIFRYIIEFFNYRGHFKRLWISSLTQGAIKEGFKNIRPGKDFDGLAEAAKARSRADWLVGMNYSRAYALTSGEPLFVGRVQTPTLAIICQRDEEIAQFKPEKFIEIKGKFRAQNDQIYSGNYIGDHSDYLKNKISPKPKHFSEDGELALIALRRIRQAHFYIESIEKKNHEQPPPLLYDLTELQRHANRLYNFSSAFTLELAQSLYEKHKLISYPRTDSKYLSSSVEESLPDIINHIRKNYEKGT